MHCHLEQRTALGYSCSIADYPVQRARRHSKVLSWKTLGWAAIVYNVYDVLTFSAVLLLIVGECTATYIAHGNQSRDS